jgi:hypothetical protein
VIEENKYGVPGIKGGPLSANPTSPTYNIIHSPGKNLSGESEP